MKASEAYCQQDTNEYFKRKTERLHEIVDILYAWELLEYHDKNYLPYDNCERSKMKLELLNELRNMRIKFAMKEDSVL